MSARVAAPLLGAVMLFAAIATPRIAHADCASVYRSCLDNAYDHLVSCLESASTSAEQDACLEDCYQDELLCERAYHWCTQLP